MGSFFLGGVMVHSVMLLKKTWGTLGSGIAVHSYIPMWQLDFGIAVQSTDKKTQSKSEEREATKKRDAPCSTSVFKSEGGAQRIKPDLGFGELIGSADFRPADQPAESPV